MSSPKRQPLLAWSAGLVFASILCAHAIARGPGITRETTSRGPLLAQAASPASAWLNAKPPAAAFFPAPRKLPSRPLKLGSPQSRLLMPLPKASAAYRYTFRVLLSHPEITDRYDAIILEQAHRYDINPRLIKAIIAAESEFSNSALSPRGARGLMQVMPRTAQEVGVSQRDLSDPAANIKAGAAYLSTLYAAAWAKYRLKGVPRQKAPLWILQRIVAAYNAGPRALRRDHWIQTTRNYVRKVLLFYGCEVTQFRRGVAQSPSRGPREDTLP